MNEAQNQQPISQQTSAQQHAAAQAALRQRAAVQGNQSLYKKLAIGLAVVLLLVVAFFVYRATTAAGEGIKSGQYQAVFLANGQVYFGKLDDPNSKYLTLSDVYYLQVQPNQEEGDKRNQNQQLPQGEPQLIKLGEELHGPEDEMKILQSQVTFWENLKNDSKVVKAIEEFKKK